MKVMTKIKSLRQRRGLSQEELAERSGLSLRTVQRIENGETEPRGDSLRKLAAALDIASEELADTTVSPDNRCITGMLLSAFSFILFPLLGILVPLVLWMVNKDRVEGLNRAAKSLIGFEITWNALLMIGWLTILIFGFVGPLDRSGDVSQSLITGYIKNIFLLVVVAYVWNAAFIVLNIVRLHKGKQLFFFPQIFLRPRRRHA